MTRPWSVSSDLLMSQGRIVVGLALFSRLVWLGASLYLSGILKMIETIDWLVVQLASWQIPSTVIICLALVIGLHICLPQSHQYTAAIKLPLPPAQVWNTVAAVERYPSWRSHVVSVEPLGKSSFIEHVARAQHHLTQKQHSEPPPLGVRARRIDMRRISDDTLVRQDRALRTPLRAAHAPIPLNASSIEREWLMHIQPSGTGSLFTLTETVRSQGTLARWLGPILGFHRVSQRFLAELAREIDRQHRQRVLSSPLCESPVAMEPSAPSLDLGHVLSESSSEML